MNKFTLAGGKLTTLTEIRERKVVQKIAIPLEKLNGIGIRVATYK